VTLSRGSHPLGQLGWLASESLRGFVRSRGAVLSAISSTALSCSLLFVALLLWQSFSAWSAEEASRQGRVEAFLKEDRTATGLEALAVAARGLPGVAQVEVVTKERARELFVQEFGPEMLRSVEGNPLPASVRVRLAGAPGPEDVARVAAQLGQLDAVESVQTPEADLASLRELTAWAGRAALIAGILLAGVVFGVVRNSVQLSLKARDRLIDNMRILGADRFQIEAPFAVEGLLQGLLGGFLAAAIPWILLATAGSWVPLQLPTQTSVLLPSALAVTGFSAATGLLSGWWTVHRALK